MISSHIDAVTVFRKGARVTRLASVEGPGSHLLAGLPLCLSDSSVRVEVDPAHGLTCLDARVELHTPPAGEEELFDSEGAEARARVERLAAQVELLLRELSRFRELELEERPDVDEAHDPLAVAEARVALLDFRRAEVLRCLESIERAQARRAEATVELARVEERQRQASSARKARSKELRKAVRVRLEGQGRATLRLSYTVPGARWSSTLQCRFDSSLTQAELRRGALVRQRSGEDWSGVQLRLSTAMPSAWTELKPLLPLRIGRAQPAPRSTWRPPPTGAGALYQDFDAAFGSAPPPPPRPGPVPEPSPAWEAAGMLAEEAADLDMLEMDAPSPSRRREKRKGARAAPPAPQGHPMPAPMPAPMARSMSLAADPVAAGAALFGAIADGVGGVAAQAPPPPLPAVVEGDDFRDYGRLRMGGPRSSHRGLLRPVTLEGARQKAVARALAQASQLGPVPGGHRGVDSIDGYDFSWEIGHRVDLPSDGQPHALALERASTGATPRYVVVPREAREVFRQVELRNDLGTPLLPGPVEVFVGDAYLLTTHLAALRPHESTRIGLGVEQAIEVARNSEFNERSEGLLVSELHLVHHLKVELRNHLDREVEVEVRERVPVSSDDEVKVKELGATPEWEEWPEEEDGPEGGRRWRVRVPARSDRSLRARYEVQLPNKHELVGGNRREV